jgi:hypothetical protein
MKLYAHISTDKLVDGKNIVVQKGQGSNKRISINLIDEKKALIAFIEVTHISDSQKPVIYFTDSPHNGYLTRSRDEYDVLTSLTKGKQQKTV